MPSGVVRLAVARGQRRAEFGLVGVGGFVQVDMHEHLVAQRRDQAHQRRRLLRRAVLAERTVRVDRVRVPAMDAFVRPRADARHDQQVDAPGVVGAMLFDELQRAVHAAGFVAVHAAGHEDRRQRLVPVARTDRELREGFIAVVQAAVLADVETRTQAIDARDDVVGVTAMAHLGGEPVPVSRRRPTVAAACRWDRRKRKSWGRTSVGEHAL